MTLLGNKQLTHPKECLLREVHCPVQLCTETVPLSRCMDHIYTANHKTIFQLGDKNTTNIASRIFEVNEATFMLNWSVRPLHLTLGPGEDFFFEVIRESKTREWIFFTYYIGSKKDSQKYESEIRIEGNKSMPGTHIYKKTYSLAYKNRAEIFF